MMRGLRRGAGSRDWLALAAVMLLLKLHAQPAKPISPTRASEARQSEKESYSSVLKYISATWPLLTRSMDECKTVRNDGTHTRSVIYIPSSFGVPRALGRLENSCPIKVDTLSRPIRKLGEMNLKEVHPAGLLYLPHPYVVPGGMFNEMYGWDSYFIARGLLAEGNVALARGMAQDFFFEIQHYGAILNANRVYFLTRSQPPFLSEMVRAIYDAEEAQGGDGRAWIAEAYPFVAKTDQFWTHPPNLAGATGLSRYYDFGEGPAPELGASMDSYYRHAIGYFLAHPSGAPGYLIQNPQPSKAKGLLGPDFPVYVCNPGGRPVPANPSSLCERAADAALTPAFYKGDRSTRESGFDISFRFGPFGDATEDYAAVGLNCLLYREEKDLEWMSGKLGKTADAVTWAELAHKRRENINRYLWNPRRGLYFDYDFKTQKQSAYLYATTFYPLWTGVASASQARAVIGQLRLLEEPGGIVMSRERSGGQWDYPYGWAPIQLIAVEGLERYHDHQDALRIAADFLSMVNENFLRDHTLLEKYNVVTRSSETHVSIGYSKNQIGFGWTNGVFLVLYDSELRRR
jgi:alpha,alpha-trehalase